MDEITSLENELCPKCNSPLAEITVTATGRKLQRCSKGMWNPEIRKNEGCPFIKWFEVEPQELDEKCPKCGNKLMFAVTRFGKKMKKCSTGTWNPQTKKAEGCDYVEWINNPVEELNEDCPECGKKLVLFTTSSGKKMKKCSTAGWDKAKREATGCPYIYWLKPHEYPPKLDSGGEEYLPPPPEEE